MSCVIALTLSSPFQGQRTKRQSESEAQAKTRLAHASDSEKPLLLQMQGHSLTFSSRQHTNMPNLLIENNLRQKRPALTTPFARILRPTSTGRGPKVSTVVDTEGFTQ